MWFDRYEERLASWYELRNANQSAPLEQALLNINDWWQSAPIVSKYLNWNEIEDWPDPWDLLADNRYCDLAKALGIVYTIHMINRPDITGLEMAANQDLRDNLVLVNQGKYILNWAPGVLLNITSPEVSVVRTIDSRAVTKKIN